MAKDIPDYMREFDTSEDWGFTPVTSKPESSKPSIDPKVVEGTNIELSKITSLPFRIASSNNFKYSSSY